MHEIFLVQNEEQCKECSHWLALARNGSLDFDEWLDIRKLREQLDLAAKVGFKQNLPLLLSDSTPEPQQFLLLKTPLFQKTEKKVLVDFAVETTQKALNFTKENLGIYFSPDLIGESYSIEILNLFLEHFLESKIQSQKIFILIHHLDYNKVLNLILRIKNKLEDTEKHLIHIYH